MLARLGAIPPKVNEAATIAGASWWRRLVHIPLPLMRHTFGFVPVANTAANFPLLAPVYIITNGRPNGSTALLMFEAYRAAFSLLDEGRSLATSIVILLIVAAVAMLESRLFRSETLMHSGGKRRRCVDWLHHAGKGMVQGSDVWWRGF